MASGTLVSIVIVVFNARSTIGSCIESVQSQTYPFKELVIIDGGSTDGTKALLDERRNEFAYYVSEKDQGIYDAMNKGIHAAKGQWVYFLGSDDILLNKDVLSEIFGDGDHESYDVLYGNVRFKSNQEVYGGSRTYTQLIGKNINHQALFYKRKIFDVVGTYNLRYKILADYDLNLRIFHHPDITTKYVPVDVCLFNNKGGASNITIDRAFFEDKLRYFTRTEKRSSRDPLLQQYFFYLGFVELMVDKRPTGFAKCFRAFMRGPRKLFYFLVFIKFILSYIGIGKKIRVV